MSNPYPQYKSNKILTPLLFKNKNEINAEMLAVLKELQESAAYWSEYDVPIGIVDRINQAIAKAEGTT